MGGDHLGTIEHTHLGGRGHDDQRAADVGMRHRVVVEVEADVRCLAHLDLDAIFGGKHVAGKREEHASLLGEDVAHRSTAVLGTRAVGRFALRPGRGLSIEVVEIGVGSRGEEGVARVANGPLDTPLLVATRGRDGARLEAVVARELEQGGVKANGVAGPLEDGTLEVVVEQNARNAAEEGEGL